MPKKKLQRFEEMKGFSNAIQPVLDEVLFKDYILKGKWNSDFFHNNYPIILELGCGKGEYTVGLAEKFSENNYIGIDVKGARMWRGCKTAIEKNLKNVGFLRTRIDLINSFFSSNEISEIWITFPDPQKEKKNKRLTAAKFLNIYHNFLKTDGIIHLKTDSDLLFEYTSELVKANNLPVHFQTNDLYHSGLSDDILSIKTFYESQFLMQNKTIKYIKFSLIDGKTVEEI